MATHLSPKQAEDMLKTGEAILLDVCDVEVFKTEHIPYATSLPLNQVANQLPQLANQPKKIIFQCMRGVKSQQACELAAELGDKVYNLEGGINAWKAAGLPTVTAKTSTATCSLASGICGHKLSVTRQMQIILGIVLLLIYLLIQVGVSFLFYLIPILGIGLIIAGLIGFCPLMKILEQMPWNKKP